MEIDGPSSSQFWFGSDHPKKWGEICKFLKSSDLAHAINIDEHKSTDRISFTMIDPHITYDRLVYRPISKLADVSIEEFSCALQEIKARPYDKNREVLQYVYDYLKQHGDWPLRSELLTGDFYDKYGHIDHVAESIGGWWIQAKIGDGTDERTFLRIRGVYLCEGSQEDINVFFRAVQYLVKIFRENKGKPRGITFDELKEGARIPDEQLQRMKILLCTEPFGNLNRSDGNVVATLRDVDETIMDYEPIKTIADYLKAFPWQPNLTTKVMPSDNITANPLQPKGANMLDIFISHSSSDMEVAEVLIELLRSALTLPAEQIRCTSVDGYRLPIGADTDEELRRELKEAKVFIALISEESIHSTYVLFEMGARWGAEKHLAPLLTPGTKSSILSGPLKSLNALQCDNSSQLHQLVSDLSKILKVPTSSPASYSRFIDRLISIPPKSQGDMGESNIKIASSAEKTGLSEAEKELLAAANKGGRFDIIDIQQREKWVRVDGKDFTDDDNLLYARRYRKALESLEERGYVMRENDHLFFLTEEGAEAIKQAKG
jgi:hypothetical protein